MSLKIPPGLNESFNRLVKFAPPELVKNKDFLKSTLSYLALGGESLARLNITVSKMNFPDVTKLFGYTPVVVIKPVADPENSQTDNDEQDKTS